MKPLTAILITAPIFFGAVSLVNSCHKSSETIRTLENENRYLLEKVHEKQTGQEVHLIKGKPLISETEAMLILSTFEPLKPMKSLQAEKKCKNKAECDKARANLFATIER